MKAASSSSPPSSPRVGGGGNNSNNSGRTSSTDSQIKARTNEPFAAGGTRDAGAGASRFAFTWNGNSRNTNTNSNGLNNKKILRLFLLNCLSMQAIYVMRQQFVIVDYSSSNNSDDASRHVHDEKSRAVATMILSSSSSSSSSTITSSTATPNFGNFPTLLELVTTATYTQDDCTKLDPRLIYMDDVLVPTTNSSSSSSTFNAPSTATDAGGDDASDDEDNDKKNDDNGDDEGDHPHEEEDDEDDSSYIIKRNELLAKLQWVQGNAAAADSIGGTKGSSSLMEEQLKAMIAKIDNRKDNKSNLYSSRQIQNNNNHGNGHVIPKIVHVTSKSRCLTKAFYDNVQHWKLPGHQFYFHDDAAVDRLLSLSWPEFPELQKMYQNCMISGAAKADLWRYLVLYKYGGIFTDIDNAPAKHFFIESDPAETEQATTTTTTTTVIDYDNDDSFFVVERIGVLSQYFMASSPGHPLMFTSVLQVFRRLMDVKSIASQYVPFVTGPGALKNAFVEFMRYSRDHSTKGKVKRGLYVGHNNRTVRVVGGRQNSDKYVKRNSVKRSDKSDGYKIMGMTHFSSGGVVGSREEKQQLNISCYLHLYDQRPVPE